MDCATRIALIKIAADDRKMAAFYHRIGETKKAVQCRERAKELEAKARK